MAKKFKMTKQHKFLGKTLPRAIGGAAKFAFKQPLTVAGAYIGAKLVGKAFRRADKGISFPVARQFNKKGRKI